MFDVYSTKAHLLISIFELINYTNWYKQKREKAFNIWYSLLYESIQTVETKGTTEKWLAIVMGRYVLYDQKKCEHQGKQAVRRAVV